MRDYKNQMENYCTKQTPSRFKSDLNGKLQNKLRQGLTESDLDGACFVP